MGFAWGPGNIFVYETLYNTSGICWYHYKCLCMSSHSFALLLVHLTSCVFQVLWDLVAHSSMRSGKMRTYIPPFYVNSSTSHITSLLVCKRLEMISQARARNPSKATETLHSFCTCYCFSSHWCEKLQKTNMTNITT